MLAAHRGAMAADLDAVAATLVKISQLIIETPDILLLDLDPIFASAAGVIAASARILLRPAGSPRPRLIISPYPVELISVLQAQREKFTIRPVRPEDAAAHAAFLGRLSPEDLRYRFFSAIRKIQPQEIARMTDVDYEREIAFIAVRENNATAGVARLVRNELGGASAEFAIVVDAAARRCGVAARLMRAIIDWGKSQRITLIEGRVLADNAPMLAFIRRLGFTVTTIADEPGIMGARLHCGPEN